MTVASFTADDVARETGKLAELLMDAVASGASVGFLPPLERGGRSPIGGPSPTQSGWIPACCWSPWKAA
jgi:hypothetical protein